MKHAITGQEDYREIISFALNIAKDAQKLTMTSKGLRIFNALSSFHPCFQLIGDMNERLIYEET